MSEKIKKLLSYRFTFMLVPHGGGRPRQLNIHVSLIAMIFFTWASVTFWGAYLSAQHIDYWRTQISNKAMELKIKYLLARIDQSREYLDEVKSADLQLREFLSQQSPQSILSAEQNSPAKSNMEGTGGPNLIESNDLTRLIQSGKPDISWASIYAKIGDLKSETQNRLTSFDELTNWIDRQRRLARATPRGWPCKGWLTSKYGDRNSPFDGTNEFHPGIDISGPKGSPIRATADGTVRLASWVSGYGNLVLLEHEFGYSTRYAHNSKILVKHGQSIKRGEVIALMGTTGKSSGNHCHYEVWRNNTRKNPISFLKDEFKPEKFELAKIR